MIRNNERPHILLVTSELGLPGGLERMVASLANSLCKHNYRVSLLIAGESRSSFYSLDQRINISTLNVHFGINSTSSFIKKKLEFAKHTLQLKFKVNNIRPDIIITNDYPYTSALASLGLYNRYKIIHWQLSSFRNKKSFLWKQLTRWSLQKVFAVIAINTDEAQICESDKIECGVIPNFLSLHNSRSRQDSHTILTVAKLSYVKGIDLLMNAANTVLKKHSNWTWKVIGMGPLQADLLNFIDQSGLRGKLIHELPHINDLKDDYQHAAIYVLPSRMESFGMVLLEAMSYGVPCIAFDCETGPRHIISHDIDGLLVEKESSTKLAEAIYSLIDDKEKRSKLGNTAFENVKRYADENVIPMWEKLFNG